MTDFTDVVIVGAGPAGLAAVKTLRASGLNVAVIDEQPRPGGQFLRPPPEGFRVKNWLKGQLYRNAKELLEEVTGAEEIVWRFNTIVLDISRPQEGNEAGFELHLQTGAGMSRLRARRIILAGGCREAPLPFPGWTLPGVMGAGAIQTLLKSQQVLAGERLVLVGSHPLQLIVADQVLNAGGHVGAVIFAQSWTKALRFLTTPHLLLRNWPQLIEVGRILLRLKAAGVPVLFGQAPIRADGEDRIERLVTDATDRDGALSDAREQVWESDCVGLCFGFQVSSELARQAGCDTVWSPYDGGWLVRHDPWMRTSVPGIYAAGELTGQAGADAAIEEGIIAAAGTLKETGHLSVEAADHLARPSRRRLKAHQSFSRTLNRIAAPPPKLAWSLMTGTTVICRCEDITASRFDERLEQGGPIESADAAKLVTRVGMGLCQGRMCYPAVAGRLCEGSSDQIEQLGPFHANFPVKPITIADVITDAD